jgi:hypothetical protein
MAASDFPETRFSKPGVKCRGDNVAIHDIGSVATTLCLKAVLLSMRYSASKAKRAGCCDLQNVCGVPILVAQGLCLFLEYRMSIRLSAFGKGKLATGGKF